MRHAPTYLLLTLALPVALLTGCAGGPTVGDDGDIPDAVPKFEPKSKRGNMSSYVVFNHRYYTRASSRDYVERGTASWYGSDFHGRATSNGERYDMYDMSAAHKTLPLPTYARVTNLENGRSTVLRINDRGPFHDDRLIDLSYSAARKLGVLHHGTARVEVRSVDPRDHGLAAAPPPRSAPVNDTDGNAFTFVTATTPRSLPTTPASLTQSSAPVKTRAAAVQPHSRGNVYLQVAALRNRPAAEQLQQRLRPTTAQPVRVVAVNNATLYRVYIGPFTDHRHAQQTAAQLRQSGVLAQLDASEPMVIKQ